MLGSRVRAPEGVQSKRLIINDYRSFCFWCVAPVISNSRVEKGHLRGNVIHFVIHKIGWLNLFAQQCKQMNISINTVFRKDRLNSQNAAPVHLRLTQTRKNKFISTGVTRSIDDWDFENQRIKAKTPELQALQLRIDTKIDELRRKIKRLEALEVEVTLDNLLETNGRKINCTVGEYLKQTIERLEILGKYGSASKHRSLLSRLSQFRSLNIRFDEIDLAYLHDFELFLRKEGNTNNSIATKYTIFKAAYNKALAEGLFVPKTTPFTKYMATLRYCDIVDGRIYYSRHKTQKLLSFQLVPNAMRIIEKYSKAKQSSATLSC